VLCIKCAANLPEGSQFCLKCGQPVNGAWAAAAALPPPTIAVLACSKCGATLPEEAQFCAKCGKPVSLPAKTAPISERVASGQVIPSQVPRPKLKLRPVLWVLLVVVLVASLWAATSDSPYAQGIQDLVGWKHDQTVLQTPFSVSPHTFRYYKFSLPPGSLNVAIIGQFSASSDTNKSHSDRKNADKDNGDKDKDADTNIEVYVMSEAAFTVWQNGYAASSVYESGRVSQGTMEAELPPGAGIYYLVFNNKFAPKAAKNVNATVLLRYKNWVPESFRRSVDRFWNWIGL
jgi:ribosomal protein L40E